MITTSSTKVVFPQAGPNRTEVIQSFADNAVGDIQKLATESNINSNLLSFTNVNLLNDINYLRTALKELESNQAEILKNATEFIKTLDFHSRKDIMYAANTPEANKLIMDQKYGQVYLPAVEISPVFYNEDASTGEIFPIQNLVTTVTIENEPTLVAFDKSIDEGTPNSAFNGQNNSMWVRTVSYPLEAPITEVTVTLEVSFPNSTDVKKFNTVRINPFPVERCDILGVWYKPNANSAWVVLEEYPRNNDINSTPADINNIDHTQYIGQIRQIYAAKIKIRQRNWIEQDNRKVFTYGLQELDFKNVSYSTINANFSSTSLKDNNHLVIKVSSPTSANFTFLSKLVSDPLFNLEGATTDNNHMLIYISKTPSITTASDILWKNTSDPLPSVTAVPLNLNTYYVIIMMKYVQQIRSTTSPFLSNSTPVLNNLVMYHLVASTITGPSTPTDTTDWVNRNWALHKIFVGQLDTMYGAANINGANIYLLGDDFWTSWTHRVSLTDVVIDEKKMSLKTTTTSASQVGTVVYGTITNTIWNSGINSFVPQQFRFQSVSELPGNGAEIKFIFSYTTVNGAQTPIEILATENNNSWTILDTATNGDIIDFTLSVQLTNPTVAGSQPILGQFILMLKD